MNATATAQNPSTKTGGDIGLAGGLIAAFVGAACVVVGVYRDYQTLNAVRACTQTERQNQTAAASPEQLLRGRASWQAWQLYPFQGDLKTASPVIFYSAESNHVTYTQARYQDLANAIATCAQRQGRVYTKASQGPILVY